MIEVTELSLPGVLKITPIIYSDERGFFTEIYNSELFKTLGIKTEFIQDSTSYSKKNVVRGLHYQSMPHAQDKLVRCVHGNIYDVAADVDPASETYGQHIGEVLTAEEQTMLFIPGKYAHGFCVTSADALVDYKLSMMHNPDSSGGVAYNDPVLNIQWPVTTPILSEKDATSWEPLPEKKSIT